MAELRHRSALGKSVIQKADDSRNIPKFTAEHGTLQLRGCDYAPASPNFVSKVMRQIDKKASKINNAASKSSTQKLVALESTFFQSFSLEHSDNFMKNLSHLSLHHDYKKEEIDAMPEWVRSSL